MAIRTIVLILTLGHPQVLLADELELIYFDADWCGPCAAEKDAIEQFADGNPSVVVSLIDVDRNLEVPKEYGVKEIPTIVIKIDEKQCKYFVKTERKSVEEMVNDCRKGRKDDW